MSRNSHQPVSAKTAVQLLAAGQPIYHDLLVYQAETRLESPTFSFVRDLHKMELDSLRNELDFSRMTEEQVSFLSRLSADMLRSRAIPYTHERGDLSLRRRLSAFLSFYCTYEISPEKLFVAPEREQLVSMILHMVTEHTDQILISHSLLGNYRHLCEQMGLTLASGNDDLNELLSLAQTLSPRVVIIAPSQLSTPSPLNLKALQEHAVVNPERLYIVDDSANFDISSDLNCNMNLRLASQMDLPANLILLYGLIKNTVSPDLELSFLINAPAQWVEAFDVAAEVTYSRISYPAQLYYEWLFDELLSFPFPRKPGNDAPRRHSDTPLRYAPSFEKAANDVAFKAKPVDPESNGLIRMDYGEFEHSVPPAIVKGLFKGFLESKNDGLEELVAERISAYLKVTRQVCADPRKVVLGQGAFPLFGALLSSLKQILNRAPIIALPDGSYGPIYAVIEYHGGKVEKIETDASSGFLLKSEQLRKMRIKPDLLWLTQPNNPSGLFFEPNEVQAISSYCSENEILLVADEIFFLLSDRRLGTATPPYLSFASTLAVGQKHLFLFDGLSKAFAAGGMRCGFLLAPDETWAKSIRSWLCPPPRAALRAWDALYSSFLTTSPHQFLDINQSKKEIDGYLDDARKLLSSQRDELLALLRKHNIDDCIDTPYRGGLFVLARLDERATALARTANVLVNPADWGRTPGWCRFCFSLKPEKFEKGMQQLMEFLDK
jgi:aspartate/methionine/tyrosine aminotransferase